VSLRPRSYAGCDANIRDLPDVLARLRCDTVVSVRNGADLDALEEFLAPEVVEHAPTGDMAPTTVTVGQTRRQYAAFRAAFPDSRVDVHMVVAEGDLVVTCGVLRATHTGEFAGHRPTGVTASRPEMRVYRIADGRIVETWAVMDLLGWRQQLGLPAELTPLHG
jgi:predicted ester cyclase